MYRMSWMLMVGAVAALCGLETSAAGQTAPASRRPNVVMIVADDLGYADVGVHHQSKDVKTPNIDAIAQAGVLFTNGYVSGPVCSPTRAGLMTGRYQQRFGFEQNPLGKAEEEVFGLPLDQVILPEQLKQAGYTTGAVGKWHLGNRRELRPPNRGFDEFFGFLAGAHGYFNNETPSDNINAIRRSNEPVGEDEYLTDAFTREGVRFIERHKEEPFFLYMAYSAPHSPMQAPENYLSRVPKMKDQKRRKFLAMMLALDDGVGKLMETLRRHELEEETLVIFFSDNGGPTRGNASLNTPFRGTKGTTFEGGIRVPFMMQWKGHLPAGKTEERMVIQLDLFPTIMAATGAATDTELPADHELDGKNLLPYLRGEKEGLIHENLFWRFGPRHAMRSGDWKLQWNDDEAPGLYNLADDPGETTDLSSRHPEIVQRMLQAYKQWNAQLMDPRWPGRLEGGKPANRAARS